MLLRTGQSGVLPLDRPCVMGVLNLTPDSFSDGGVCTDTQVAVSRAMQMVQEGAVVIDVGGESTRPGAARVEASEQIARVYEPIRAIVRAIEQAYPRDADAPLGIKPIVSIDTTLGDVAAAAIEAGALMLNDVSAGREDARLMDLAAAHDLPLVLMHMQGEPGTMQDDPRYDDVVDDVRKFLVNSAQRAQAAGVDRSQIVLDPGIGFGKTCEHNVALLRSLGDLVATGYAVLLGVSRKRFIAQLSPLGAESPADRVGGTCAAVGEAVRQGVHLLRVHDVLACRQAAQVAYALSRGR